MNHFKPMLALTFLFIFSLDAHAGGFDDTECPDGTKKGMRASCEDSPADPAPELSCAKARAIFFTALGQYRGAIKTLETRRANGATSTEIADLTAKVDARRSRMEDVQASCTQECGSDADTYCAEK